jgi:hypothetical protein
MALCALCASAAKSKNGRYILLISYEQQSCRDRRIGENCKKCCKMEDIGRCDFLGQEIFPSVSKGYCANLAHMLYIKTVTQQLHENLCHFGMVLFGMPAGKNVKPEIKI